MLLSLITPCLVWPAVQTVFHIRLTFQPLQLILASAAMACNPHPLSALSIDETNLARDIVLSCHPEEILYFRQILLLEPPKSEVVSFLEIEHSGKLCLDTPRPQRLAKVQHDVISKGSRVPLYQESVVDLRRKQRVRHEVIAKEKRAALTM